MPRVVLIGPPGAGKSSVGRAIARILDCDVLDTDIEIEKRAGKKISEIFTDDGEASFRALEKIAVLDALETATGVLALGGGSVFRY